MVIVFFFRNVSILQLKVPHVHCPLSIWGSRGLVRFCKKVFLGKQNFGGVKKLFGVTNFLWVKKGWGVKNLFGQIKNNFIGA